MREEDEEISVSGKQDTKNKFKKVKDNKNIQDTNSNPVAAKAQEGDENKETKVE